MKKLAKILPDALKVCMLLWAACCCMTNTAGAGRAVSGALERCLYTVIPSLYAMMIVSALIVKSGAAAAAGRFTGRLGRVLFGMDSECFPIFLFSMFAGYPVGCKMLVSLHSEGRLSKHRAELLCGVCFGAGPAFISGCIAGRLYGSPAAGRMILISTISANVLTALAVSLPLRKMPVDAGGHPRRLRLDSRLLTECVSSSGRSMAEICFTIAAFAVFAFMLEDTGILRAVGGELPRRLALTFLDITAAGELPRGNYTLLPWLSAAAAFGGVCVLFQINAIISGRLSMLPLIVIRLSASALSFGICRLIMPFMLRNETVPAAAVGAALHSEASPVPSVMLVLMTFALLRKTDREEL